MLEKFICNSKFLFPLCAGIHVAFFLVSLFEWQYNSAGILGMWYNAAFIMYNLICTYLTANKNYSKVEE